MDVYIHLFHGRDAPGEIMDEWGFDGPSLGPFDYVQLTYGNHVKFGRGHEHGELTYQDGLVLHEGKFYGDLNVSAEPTPGGDAIRQAAASANSTQAKAATLSRALIALLDECDGRLNDPRGDGSGDGAEPPSPEHYNGLQELVRELVTSWTGPETGDGAALRNLLALHPKLRDRIVDAGYVDGVGEDLAVALRDFTHNPAEAA